MRAVNLTTATKKEDIIGRQRFITVIFADFPDFGEVIKQGWVIFFEL